MCNSNKFPNEARASGPGAIVEQPVCHPGGSLLEMHTVSPASDPLNQILHFNEISKWFVHTLKFGKHFEFGPRTQDLFPYKTLVSN